MQGEGCMTGVESVFVRVSGCNLRCRFCDTPYASWSPEGEEYSIDQVLLRVDQVHRGPPPPFLAEFFAARSLSGSGKSRRQRPSDLHRSDDRPDGVRHIVLTGGEPMLFPEIAPLTARLHDLGWHITIETSGTLDLPVVCDLMSISPKLANSTPSPNADAHWASRHTANRHAPDVIRRLVADYAYQLKFVVDCPADCQDVLEYLREFPEIPPDHVMLMPQGTAADDLAAKSRWIEPFCDEHGFTFCPRRHVEWFGPARGR